MTFRRTTAALLAALIGLVPNLSQAQTLAGGDYSAPRASAYNQAFGVQAGSGSSMVSAQTIASGQQTLALAKGKSAIIDLPADARDILMSNPKVADAVLRTPRRIYLLGLETGQSDAVFFDASGRRILSLDIRVGVDSVALQDMFARLIPGSRIQVEAMNGMIVLAGEAPNALAADQAVRLANNYVADPKMVVNMMGIAGKQQVMLKVRIVEMQRTVIKQLGFDLSAVLGQTGETQYLIGKAASFAVNGSLLGGLTGGYKLDTTSQPIMQQPCGWVSDPTALCDFVTRDGSAAANSDTATVKNDLAGDPGLNKANAQIQALERVGLVRTLAEPNLTAVSGEAAKFLAGGEYPVPTGQDNTGRISVEFKPYGVGLGFTPVVLSDGRISLRLSTEVSELTSEGAFTLASGSTSSLTIPALSVRRAETTVELPSGGSMMIAGLLQERSRQSLDSLPGVMNLPVLGSLFRSRDYQKGETELVIIVTPYLVKGTNANEQQTPVDGLRVAHDMETVLLGKLNKTNGVKPGAVQGRTYQGPYGYVIE